MCDEIRPVAGFFVFDYDHPRRWHYDVHPDNPAFREEMLYFHPLWDQDPYSICTADLEFPNSDDYYYSDVSVYNSYRSDIEKSILSYYEEKCEISKLLAIEDRYRCTDGCLQAFTVSRDLKIQIDPTMDFPDAIEEILIRRPSMKYRHIYEALRVDKSLFSRWINGKQYPSTKDLMLMCIYMRTNSEEGLMLFQSTPHAPGRQDVVQQVFKGMLEADVFTTSKRSDEDAGISQFDNDVLDLLYYSMAMAKVTGNINKNSDASSIAHYFYDQKRPRTKAFVPSDEFILRAYHHPPCKVIKSYFDRFGKVQVVGFDTKTKIK